MSLKAAMRRAEYSGRPPPMPENGKEIQQYGKIKDKVKRRKITKCIKATTQKK